MAVKQIVTCDKCGISEIGSGYWMSVEIHEQLPRNGGIVHGMEWSKTLTFCNGCKQSVKDSFREIMRILKGESGWTYYSR